MYLTQTLLGHIWAYPKRFGKNLDLNPETGTRTDIGDSCTAKGYSIITWIKPYLIGIEKILGSTNV